MAKTIYKAAFTTGLLVMLLAVPAFAAAANKSIKIEAGSESSGAETVNGSVTIGENAIVSGNAETVNGSIVIRSGARVEDASTVNGKVRLEDGVQAENVSTVNGSVKIGEEAGIGGSVETVNGKIQIAKGTSVAGSVGNVNGEIELSGAAVGGDVSTVTGDVYVIDATVVTGDLVVEKPGGWSWKKPRTPKLVIGPGSRIKGVIRLEREAELFISESAKVGGVEGEMNIDDAVRFSGDRP